MQGDPVQFPPTLPKTGAIIAQLVRCGKPSCRCARGELHGPYFYRFHRERGRLVKRYVRKSEAAGQLEAQARLRARIAAFRGVVKAAEDIPGMCRPGASLLDRMLRKLARWPA